ncbi:hypothetical protein [Butyrivibrio sp. YAB3001]|uniref:hypothetical protein n=1 Tax=Butyrivibrio sp. YAB3001 TaxID=1520812 RepID=UPI0008F61C56|nr:hypothetical protein [Butyrivibrio sp. YAB3001]SFC53613.1 hypothetical protein SAMN02910398_02479 [Butyrivibrio sp. YAB3001]
MKKGGFVLYMLLGVTLVVSGFATTERGLKENDREMLYNVAEDYEELGDMGFKGFYPLDYKVAFSDSEKEILVSYDEGKCNFSERKAVYGGLVGSIYQDGDEFEVIVPEYDTWITLENLNDEPLSVVIWHEGFHAYQNSYHKAYEKVTSEVISETDLSEVVDSNIEGKKLFSEMLKVLERIITDENYGNLREIAIEYSKIANERRKLFGDEVNKSEDYYVMIEGTAYYVESQAARLENGEKLYRDNYLGTASKYAEGNAKYYRLGMLECMLLDKLAPDWKDSYGFDRTLDEVIEAYTR